jgi:D-methionine transport system ATP-binding protein
MITIEGLSKTYAGTGRPALNDIALQIPKGAIYGILGRSGAGKSTLIRCLNLLERPTSGRILVNGQDITQLNKAALRDYRLRTGMIFQHFNLLHARTVADNIAVPLEIAGVPRAARERGCANCWSWWISAKRPPLSRRSFPAGKNSASASPGRWPPAGGAAVR